MRFLLRWTLRLFCTLSLLLCVAAATLCIRSYWVNDWAEGKRYTSAGEWSAWAGGFRGSLWIGAQFLRDRTSGYNQFSCWTEDAQVFIPSPDDPSWGYLGLRTWVSHSQSRYLSRYDLLFPLWIAVVVFALAPAAWFLSALRHRRKSRRQSAETAPPSQPA